MNGAHADADDPGVVAPTVPGIRITGWQVDGFGQLTDASATDLGPGLTVLYGPNEAGKTTVMAFVRRMLFGFPDKRTRIARDNAYEPVRGGQPGGRLHLDVGEPATIERLGKRVDVRIGSREGGQELLTGLLRGVDAEVYRNVYAFGLDELARLETLEADGVRDILLSAGLHGAGASGRAARVALQATAAERYLARGRKHEILRIQHELDQVAADLTGCLQDAQAYPAARRAEAAARRAVGSARERTASLQAGRDRDTLLLELWPTWLRREDATAALTALGPVPELSGTELDAIREDLARAVETDRVSTERVEVLTAQVRTAEAGVGPEPTLVAPIVATRLRHLAGRTAEVERIRTHLAATDADIAELTAARARILADAGADAAALDELEVGIAVREAVDDHARHVARTRESLDRSERALEAIERLVRDVDAQPASSFDPALAGRRLDEARQAVARSQEHGGATGSIRNTSVIGALLALLSLLLVIGGQPLVAGLVGIVAAMCGVLARGMHRRRTRVTARLDAAVRRTHADLVELVGLPDDSRLEVVADAVAEGRARVRQHQDADRGATGADRDAAMRACAAAQVAHRDATAAWSAWLTERELAPTLGPEAARRLLDHADALREQAGTHQRLQQRVVTATEELRAIQDDLSGLGHELELPTTTGDLLVDLLALEPVVAGLQRDEAAAAQRTRAIAEHERLASDLLAARADAARATAELERICAEVSASSVTSGRQRIDLARRAMDLRDTETHAARALDARLGRGPHAEEMADELARGAVDEWEHRRQEAAGDLELATVEHEAAVAELTDRRRAREAVEVDARVAELANRESSLLARRDAAARAWAVAWLADGLIGDTLQRYEAERQPAVLLDAGARFAAATDGAYTAVRQRDGGMTVVRPDGAELGVGLLSRGAAELLYLCLRLALVDDQASRTVALPIVLDDVLVNCDPARARRTAQLLLDTAARHQVLYLTCHPHVVELLTDTAAARSQAIATVELTSPTHTPPRSPS